MILLLLKEIENTVQGPDIIKLKGFCKIEVRHILFKKICFFDFLK